VGYLVEHELAFGSFIELLDYARQKQWVNRQRLWAEDRFDRL
jgi:hypothetical protein